MTTGVLFKGMYDRGIAQAGANPPVLAPYDSIGAVKGIVLQVNAKELMPNGPTDVIAGSAGDTKIQSATSGLGWVNAAGWPLRDRAMLLRVLGGPGLPAWMKDTDPTAANLPNSNGQRPVPCVYAQVSGQGGTMAAWWTQTFRQKVKILTDKMAAAYDNNAAIRLVEIFGPCTVFNEGGGRQCYDSGAAWPNHVIGPCMASLMLAGWDINNDLASFQGFIYDMAASFGLTNLTMSLLAFEDFGVNEPGRAQTQTATTLTPNVAPGWANARFNNGAAFLFGSSGYLTADASGGTAPTDTNAKFSTGTRPVVPKASGTANAAVTTTNTTISDTRNPFLANMLGRVVTCNGKTMTVTATAAGTLTGASWSGGSNPGNGFAWSVQGDIWFTVGSIVQGVVAAETIYCPIPYEVIAVVSDTVLTIGPSPATLDPTWVLGIGTATITAPGGSGTINSRFNHSNSLLGAQYFIGHPALPLGFTYAVTTSTPTLLNGTFPVAGALNDHILVALNKLNNKRSSLGNLDEMDNIYVTHQAILGQRGLVGNDSLNDVHPMPPLAGIDRDLLTPPAPPNHYQMSAAAITLTTFSNIMGVPNPYQPGSSYELPDGYASFGTNAGFGASAAAAQAQAIVQRQQLESLPNT